MSSLNVAEWSPDQVEEWISGLGPTVAVYAPVLRERGLDGNKLLMLRCDDLEYLGMHIIGHQELLLEAVEHLRNFQYEARRECVQQLAARVSVAATGLARALARGPAEARAADARLDTQTLADVAGTVRAVKPLVCWLDRWPVGAAGGPRGLALAARRAQLLQRSLEAATCAQRDRFAHQPARAVAAAAAAAAAAADYIVQEVSDPMILQPASLDTVTLRQGGKALGFEVVPSFCGHHQLADIRFGSPAHASGLVHEGDEIVQVGERCVVGWSGASVAALCAQRAAGGELPLRLRRRAARPPPVARPLRLRTRHRPPPLLHNIQAAVRTIHPIAKTLGPAAQEARAAEARASSSSDSEALSPPASPHLPLPAPPDRMKAAWLLQRRHTVAGASPGTTPTDIAIHQFWRQVREQRWGRGPPDALYRRDKAVSCSTGLELSPRPRTCTGVPSPASPEIITAMSPGTMEANPGEPAGASNGSSPANVGSVRGRLDKSYSTPAYGCSAIEPGTLRTQVIPESPTSTPADSPTILVHSAEKADQILDFKKSSSQIGEAILQQQKRDLDRDLVEGNQVQPCGVEGQGQPHLGRSQGQPYPGAGQGQVWMPDEPTAPSRMGRSSKDTLVAAVGARAGTGGAVDVVGGGGVGVLRAVPRPPSPPMPRPTRALDVSQISLPLRHITKHDIKVIPSERRELPPINLEMESPVSPSSPESRPHRKDSGSDVTEAKVTLSPSAAVVKSIFPTSKSRSLKKKNSILAKRRCIPLRTLLASSGGGGAASMGAGSVRVGVAWQRVRARHAQQPRWARRHLLLAHRALYAYRSLECSKADCMINLEGFTVCAAGEVKSRAHAFKVYHTGTAFYFAAESRDDMLAWIQAVARATLHAPALSSQPFDISQQFSETDYSDTESDSESCERRERERREEREREKDKSKFGSLKKLTVRMQRSESQENVGHSTSLDRKYLRFFSRNKSKDDSKPSKVQPPVAPPSRAPPPPPPPPPSRAPPPLPAPALTLEQFMLAEQADTRRQMYTDRVVLGIQTNDIQRRLDNVAADTGYSQLPSSATQSRVAPRPLRPVPPRRPGLEKSSYTEDPPIPEPGDSGPHERWRDSLRRNHKVHSASSKPATSGASSGTSWGGPGMSRLRLALGAPPSDAPQYPHLQCPPTFQPESYSLARLAPPTPPAPP